ncbi:Phenylacetic acid catabolic protein [Pseudomonas coleopterorum]|uniref:Phenylacetic acid catabolic protein n=1 Tax=Pseudomonas coleopterorum TaxID=1605838 RepID=UPI002A6A5137|nr:Phenylacetic acid catabolic protein [Pseudomonas coleopterorum]MDY1046646.1 Phenylacetic acid catabolic protein [Pseudomonas coleopterorum]
MPPFSPRLIKPLSPTDPGGVEQVLDHQLQRLLPTHHWLCRAPSLKRKVQWLRRLLDETHHALLLLDRVAALGHPPGAAQPWPRPVAHVQPAGTLADFAVTSWLLDAARADPVADAWCADASKRNQRNTKFHRRQAFELLLVMSTQQRPEGMCQVQAALDRQWPKLLAQLADWPARAREDFMKLTAEQIRFLGCRPGSAPALGSQHE